MSKDTQVSNQLNLKFTGQAKSQLLEQLKDYLSRYQIGKADFVAICIKHGIDNDLASFNKASASSSDSQAMQNAINEAIAPIQQQLQELAQRLGELKGNAGRRKS